MGKFLDKFLEIKNEDSGTKKLMLFALIILTAGLAALSISGAFAKSSGGLFSFDWIPRLAYASVVLGLELLAAALFMRAMLARDWKRMAVCLAVLPFLIWANVQNAKDGLHYIMPNTFAESSAILNAKADLAREEAKTLGGAQTAAIAGSGAELERVRTQIAELRTEQQIMASMSPEGIEKAQSLLLAQGLYFGSVDGLRQDKTESAMRARGEAIQAELATLKAREDGLMAGQASPVMSANTAKRLEEITQRDKARMAAEAEWRAEVIFWVAEFARNLLLWAAITSVTAVGVSNVLRRQEEIEDAEHQAKLAAIRAAMAPTPPPVAVEPPPPPIPPPEPEPAPAATPEPIAALEPDPEPEPIVLVDPVPEMTDQQRAARQGGLAAQHERRAAKTERLLVIGPTSTLDAAPAQVAAE